MYLTGSLGGSFSGQPRPDIYWANLDMVCHEFVFSSTRPDHPPPDLALMLNFFTMKKNELTLVNGDGGQTFNNMVVSICNHHRDLSTIRATHRPIGIQPCPRQNPNYLWDSGYYGTTDLLPRGNPPVPQGNIPHPFGFPNASSIPPAWISIGGGSRRNHNRMYGSNYPHFALPNPLQPNLHFNNNLFTPAAAPGYPQPFNRTTGVIPQNCAAFNPFAVQSPSIANRANRVNEIPTADSVSGITNSTNTTTIDPAAHIQQLNVNRISSPHVPRTLNLSLAADTPGGVATPCTGSNNGRGRRRSQESTQDSRGIPAARPTTGTSAMTNPSSQPIDENNSNVSTDTPFSFLDPPEKVPVFPQLPGREHWIPIPPDLHVPNRRHALAPYLGRLFGNAPHGKGPGGHKFRFVFLCKGGFNAKCNFKIYCNKIGDNTWRISRHTRFCVHENHLLEGGEPPLVEYTEQQALIQLTVFKTIPKQIKDYAETFKVVDTSFGQRYVNQGGLEVVLSHLRNQPDFVNSVFGSNVRVVPELRKMLDLLMRNVRRQASTFKKRRTTNGRIVEIRQPDPGTQLDLYDLLMFVQANQFVLPANYQPRSDFVDHLDFAQHVGRSSITIRDVIFLPCPPKEELQTHLDTYGTHVSGGGGATTKTITDADYKQCQSCACFTSLLQIFCTLQSRKNMPVLVRMTDGTFGHLNDRHVCLIVTGLIGTHRPKPATIARKLWVDGYVLCGRGESKWPTFVLTVALKKIWTDLFGLEVSDSLQANFVCVDDSTALQEGYLMAQKFRTWVPENSEQANYQLLAQFLGCQFHRQEWIRKMQNVLFELENRRVNMQMAIDDQRRMQACPTVESHSLLKSLILFKYRNMGLTRLVEHLEKNSVDDKRLGQFNYGAAGYPGFPMENGTVERVHGFHKNSLDIVKPCTRTHFLNFSAQQLVDADCSKITIEWPRLVVVPDTGPVLTRGYVKGIVLTYFLMYPDEKYDGTHLDSLEVPRNHELFSRVSYFYSKFAVDVRQVWLTNRPSHTRKIIHVADLDKYLAVLKGDYAFFEYDLDSFQETMQRFCLCWFDSKPTMANKNYYCNCETFYTHNHCPATLYNMDLMHAHNWEMHQFLMSITKANTYCQLVNKNQKTELMQIPRERIYSFVWSIQKPERVLALKILGLKNLPQAVSSYQFAVMIGSGRNPFHYAFLMRLHTKLYRSDGYPEVYNGVRMPSKNLEWPLRKKVCEVLKHFQEETWLGSTKNLPLRDADRYSGRSGVQRQSGREDYKDFITFVAKYWVSSDMIYCLECTPSGRDLQVMTLKVVRNEGLFVDPLRWDWCGPIESDGNPGTEEINETSDVINTSNRTVATGTARGSLNDAAPTNTNQVLLGRPPGPSGNHNPVATGQESAGHNHARIDNREDGDGRIDPSLFNHESGVQDDSDSDSSTGFSVATDSDGVNDDGVSTCTDPSLDNDRLYQEHPRGTDVQEESNSTGSVSSGSGAVRSFLANAERFSLARNRRSTVAQQREDMAEDEPADELLPLGVNEIGFTQNIMDGDNDNLLVADVPEPAVHARVIVNSTLNRSGDPNAPPVNAIHIPNMNQPDPSAVQNVQEQAVQARVVANGTLNPRGLPVAPPVNEVYIPNMNEPDPVVGENVRIAPDDQGNNPAPPEPIEDVAVALPLDPHALVIVADNEGNANEPVAGENPNPVPVVIDLAGADDDQDSFLGVPVESYAAPPLEEDEYQLTPTERHRSYGFVYDNQLPSAWRGRFGTALNFVSDRAPDGHPWFCGICSSAIQNEVFFSNEGCQHKLCLNCVWFNMITHPFREFRSNGGFVMQETGRCYYTWCNGGHRCTWYAPNYCPLRPSSGEYIYGYIGYYRVNPEVHGMPPGEQRDNLFYSRGWQLRFVKPITSPQMWNTYCELFGQVNNQEYIPDVVVEPAESIQLVVELSMEAPPSAGDFMCNRCHTLTEIKYRVHHAGCDYSCVNRYLCMKCACKIDNCGRINRLKLPLSVRFEDGNPYTMSRTQQISWRCNKCRLSGQFTRLDREPLNTVEGGLYARRAFNEINTAVRTEVGDNHDIHELPRLVPIQVPNQAQPVVFEVDD